MLPTTTDKEREMFLEIAQFLHDTRKRKGLTLTDIHNETGISRDTLTNIFDGRSNPTFATLKKITTFLGIEIKFSLKGTL